MGSLTNWAEDRLLDHIFSCGVASRLLPQPDELYVALSTGTILENGSGIVEPALAYNYERELVNAWSLIGRRVENSAAINFNIPAEPDGWGTITDVAVFARYTSGALASGAWPVGGAAGTYMIAYGALPAPGKLIIANQQPSFAPGAIDFIMDSGIFSNYLVEKCLRHLFKIEAWNAPPAALYVGMALNSETPPDDDGTGFDEPAADLGYVRKSHATWNPASNGAVSNLGGIVFAQALDNWGEMGFLGLFDGDQPGDPLLMRGAVADPDDVNIGDTPTLASGVVAVSLD